MRAIFCRSYVYFIVYISRPEWSSAQDSPHWHLALMLGCPQFFTSHQVPCSDACPSRQQPTGGWGMHHPTYNILGDVEIWLVIPAAYVRLMSCVPTPALFHFSNDPFLAVVYTHVSFYTFSHRPTTPEVTSPSRSLIGVQQPRDL